MAKDRVAFVAVITVIVIAIVLGLFLFVWQSEDRPPSESTEETATAVNLGITYLLITPKLSAYYDLGVDSGVLVTEVISNSLADKAGVRVDDVILSFNGARVEEGAPLLGMMMACTPGNRIVLEVWRGNGASIVEIVHMER